MKGYWLFCRNDSNYTAGEAVLIDGTLLVYGGSGRWPWALSRACAIYR